MQQYTLWATKNNSMSAANEDMDEWALSSELWPRWSLDLNPCHFLLWDTLKESVCE